MEDKDAPYMDGLKLHMANDASHTVIEIVTGDDATRFALTQDMLMLVLAKLRDLNAEWEKRRRQIDPTAGNAGDIAPMTATRVISFNTASIPETEEGAIVFETVHGPQAFAIPKAAMPLLAQRLLAEAERSPKMPRKS